MIVALMSNPLGNLGDVVPLRDARRGAAPTPAAGDGLGPADRRPLRHGARRHQQGPVPAPLGEWDDGRPDARRRARARTASATSPRLTTAAALVWSLRGEVTRAREVAPTAWPRCRRDAQEAAYRRPRAWARSGEGRRRSGDCSAARVGQGRANLALHHPIPFVLLWPLAARAGPRGGRPRRRRPRCWGCSTGHYVGEIPPLVRAERRLTEGRLVAGPGAARRRRRGRRERPARRRVAVPPGAGAARPRRGSTCGRQGPRRRRSPRQRRSARCSARPRSSSAPSGSARNLPPRRAAARRAP